MAIIVPTITWLGDSADYTPGFDVLLGVPGDAIDGDVLRFQYSSNAGGSWTDYLTHTLTVSELVSLTVSKTAPSIPGGTYLFRARLERGSEVGDWSANETVLLLASGHGAGERDFFGRYRLKRRRELRRAQEEKKREAENLTGMRVAESPAFMDETIVLPNQVERKIEHDHEEDDALIALGLL